MKTFIALLLFIVSGAASAASADPGLNLQRQNYCNTAGSIAAFAFDSRVKGTTKGEVYNQTEGLLKAFTVSNGGDLARFAIDYGYDKATDANDAKAIARANCMQKTN